MKGTLYGDSTGIAINGHNTWLDAKNGSRSRRDYRKLHIVTAENGIIISYDITHARCHDVPIFEQICGTLPHGSGHVMLDAAYLSRNICTLIEKIGQIPVIMPRKGVRVRGFDAMGKMLRWHRDNPDEFRSTYHKRSNVTICAQEIKEFRWLLK